MTGKCETNESIDSSSQVRPQHTPHVREVRESRFARKTVKLEPLEA